MIRGNCNHLYNSNKHLDRHTHLIQRTWKKLEEKTLTTKKLSWTSWNSNELRIQNCQKIVLSLFKAWIYLLQSINLQSMLNLRCKTSTNILRNYTVILCLKKHFKIIRFSWLLLIRIYQISRSTRYLIQLKCQLPSRLIKLLWLHRDSARPNTILTILFLLKT